MSVIVSACLLGCNCKYNGGNNYNPRIAAFVEGKEVIAVCPEQLGGLPTPRPPAEIVEGVVTNRLGESVDAQFRLGACRALELARGREIELAVLQSRSPSCGSRQVYDGTFSGRLVPGQGVFAAALSARDIPIIGSEEFEP